MERGGHFDQRPGMFEATAGLGTIYAVGRRDRDGWRVALLRGAVVLAELTSEDAAKLAADIATAAELIDGNAGLG
ncbi:hypothetical protein [Novosphingobium sp. RL4]|uniref:hypothetical protein n=1 Tax=Novosphingobium sp. RL4 TaxID=3109595 RepID=UPI002D774C06|nr:hypothetical protein [Novosphingobium sp. RL4]WRT91348.1 hypothetical protein U9J33_08895 [Novosphingobium sp. RL4]